MQRILSLALLGLTTTFAIPSDSQQRIPFSFVLTVPDKEVTAGGKITVELTIKNTSDHPIGFEAMEVSPYVATVRVTKSNWHLDREALPRVGAPFLLMRTWNPPYIYFEFSDL